MFGNFFTKRKSSADITKENIYALSEDQIKRLTFSSAYILVSKIYDTIDFSEYTLEELRQIVFNIYIIHKNKMNLLNEMNKINRLEDIWPMTIVHMRHGKFAIVEAYCFLDCCTSLQGNEEVQYDPHKFMQDEWEGVNYGIGNTIEEAFSNFKENIIKANK